ncbi:hypothetical protein Misp03_66440 [Microbispora sp. NBRC 16548]|nr:hypothetical protein Misp03_66440 [Microbispora sp. NBRC 16548]
MAAGADQPRQHRTLERRSQVGRTPAHFGPELTENPQTHHFQQSIGIVPRPGIVTIRRWLPPAAAPPEKRVRRIQTVTTSLFAETPPRSRRSASGMRASPWPTTVVSGAAR